MYSRRYNKYYRSRAGMLLGVCQGFAAWREFPVGAVRLFVIILTFFSGIVPGLLLYLGLAMFLPIEPRDSDWAGRQGDRAQYDDYRSNEEQHSSEFRKRREQDWDKKFYDK